MNCDHDYCKSKFARTCCVPGCDNKLLKVFPFPQKNREMFKKWLRRIGNSRLNSFKSEKYVFWNYGVCERHFFPECLPKGTRRGLTVGAVPTLFLPEVLNEDQTRLILSQENVDLEIVKTEQGELLSEKKNSNVVPGIAREVEIMNVRNSSECNEICTLCLNESPLKSLNTLAIYVVNFLRSFLEHVPENCCLQCLKQLKRIQVFMYICKRSENRANEKLRKTGFNNRTEMAPLNENTFLTSEGTPTLKSPENKTKENRVLPQINKKKVCKKCGQKVRSLLEHYLTSRDCRPKSKKRVRKETLKKKAKKEPKEIPDTEKTKPKRSFMNFEVQGDKKRCKNCGTLVTTIKEHYATHKQCRPKIMCPKCGKLIRRKSITTHLEGVHAENKAFRCPTCSKLFKHKLSLNRHLDVHELPKRFICEICAKAYSTKAGLDDHKNSHTGDKPYACNHCDFKSPNRSNLKMHQKNHLWGRPVICDVCNEEFPHRLALNEHKAVHEPDGTFKCGVCNEEFTSMAQYQRHCRSHFNDKPFQCRICDKRYRVYHTMKTHMKTHSNERPFSCTACPKKFQFPHHLSDHMLLHTGEKAFACEFCCKRFTLKGALTVHRRLHTGERPYKCHVCDSSFMDASARKKHVVKHHGVEQVRFIRRRNSE